MKLNKLIFTIIISMFVIFIAFLTNKNYAADLDEIENYVITVNPRMNDGSLDIIYEITWRVLDSNTEGPLSWVEIGTANPQFDSLQARSNNIRKISPWNESYVRIDFDKKYYEGEEITFKYSLHQSYMYKISWNKCKYEFTPAWFTDAKIKNMTIRWNNDGIISSNKNSREDGYFIWNKENMAKGKKMTAKVTYKKDAFSYLNEYKQIKNAEYKRYENNNSWINSLFFLFLLFIFIFAIISIFSRGNYYSHSGFGGIGYYDNYHYHGGGCVHSSCACVSSCACANSCACACAGSGRAGCSKKDFYGTKIDYEILKQLKDAKKD